MRLIDADALKRYIPTRMDMQDLYLPVHFKTLIDEQPTVDAVQVVRCKECKHNIGEKVWLDGEMTIDCANGMGYPPPNWFFADGERRE